MPTAEKIAVVEEIKERLANSQVAVITKFIGINAGQSTKLRQQLRAQNVEIKVYKNNLAKRALDELGYGAAAAFMEGPTAWAFCDDAVTPPIILRNFNKEVPLVEMSGGILSGQIISKAQLEALADLPPRDQLLGQAVGVMVAPLRNFVGVINAPMRDFVGVANAPLRDFVNVMHQIKEQKAS